jgi:acetoin:2,6-dichlorophenolindophenol oxidoreductase subunit alpha
MRPAEHLQWIKENRDPLKTFISRVTAANQLKQGELSVIDEEITALVEGVLAAAKAAPDITAENLLTDVYVSY